MRERVGKALDALSVGLKPFVQDALKAIYRDRWFQTAQASFREGRGQQNVTEETMTWDSHAVLTVIWDQWNSVFRQQTDQPFRTRRNNI